MRRVRKSPARSHSGDGWVSLKEMADRVAAEAERQAIRLALHATRGNKSEAARLLRTDYKTLHLKMKHYGIDAGKFRAS
jgi:DNA-binding NtrC family response regulator